jgi:hypothetical protein
MKFQASVLLEFQAESIGEAGQELSKLLERAERDHHMAARDVELRTRPAHASTRQPVVLPPVTTPARPPGPEATGPTPQLAATI